MPNEDYQKTVRADGLPWGEPVSPLPTGDDGDPPAGMAVRRHTDRCFHAVEEVVKEGFIVQGILFAKEDIAEVRMGIAVCEGPGGCSGDGLTQARSRVCGVKVTHPAKPATPEDAS